MIPEPLAKGTAVFVRYLDDMVKRGYEESEKAERDAILKYFPPHPQPKDLPEIQGS